MDARKVAAHFVAFTFYLNGRGKEPVLLHDAGRFARGNWQAFLPWASEDLGRFLTERPEELPRQAKPARRLARKALDRQLAAVS